MKKKRHVGTVTGTTPYVIIVCVGGGGIEEKFTAVKVSRQRALVLLVKVGLIKYKIHIGNA
jgi:hypothetical protein